MTLAAYAIAGNTVTDAETMGEYSKQVSATLEPFGGKFLVRGGQFEVMEGAWSAARVVVIEFPTLEHARRWYHSDAYQAIIQGRFDGARTDVLMFVEGVG